VNDRLTFGDRLTLTPGLKFTQQKAKAKDLSRYITAVPNAAAEIRNTDETYVTPTLAASLALTPTLEAYATYTHGTRLPTAVEKTGTYDSFSYTGAGAGYAVLGNPDLDKETSDAFELGFNGKPANGVTFRVAAFYTKYEDYIEYGA